MCETKQIWIGTKYPLDAEHEILIFQNGTPSGEGNAEGTLGEKSVNCRKCLKCLRYGF